MQNVTKLTYTIDELPWHAARGYFLFGASCIRWLLWEKKVL